MKEKPRPTSGSYLYQIDGRMLGVVDAVEDGVFQATLECGLPHWLTMEAVFTAENGRTTLICDASGLVRYVVPGR